MLKSKVGGEKPNLETIFTACDSLYFNQFFLGLSRSIARLKSKNLHIHIINPLDSDLSLVKDIQESFNKESKCSLTFSFETISLKIEENKRKVYYAISRFLIQELFTTSKCLIVDVDCLFLKDFEYPEADVGLVIEPEMPISMNVLAGCFYFTQKSIEFLKFNNRILLHLTSKATWWYVDQFSLYIAYEKFRKDFKFFFFDNNFFSNKSENNPIIFAPRGKRKNQQEFNDLYNSFVNTKS